MRPGTPLERLRALVAQRLIGRREAEDRIGWLEHELAVQRSRLDQQQSELTALRAGRVDRIAATMAWIEQAELRSSPLVSVVMPTRNRPGSLARAAASVLAQTYSNLELVIVDDASEAETANEIAAIDDPRVRSVRRNDRGGPSAARNSALELVGGELITYLDDDNRMHPAWLRSVVWAFEQRPELEVLYGALLIDDPARTRPGPGGEMPLIWHAEYDYEALASVNLADMSTIAHRAGLEQARFDEGLSLMTDWDLLARLTTNRDPLALPAIACFYYTDAPDRITAGPTELTDLEVVRRRVREARDLDPLPSDAWALSGVALDAVLGLIGPDTTVVECGSGESTLAIARRLSNLGSGRVLALEDHAAWAGQQRDRLRAEGLARWAEVIDAPLEPHPLAPPGCAWYAADSLRRLPRTIDLLLVDGPPAPRGPRERSRYPALPALADRLASDAHVLLDDANRGGERWVLERWQEETPFRFQLADGGRLAIGVT